MRFISVILCRVRHWHWVFPFVDNEIRNKCSAIAKVFDKPNASLGIDWATVSYTSKARQVCESMKETANDKRTVNRDKYTWIAWTHVATMQHAQTGTKNGERTAATWNIYFSFFVIMYWQSFHSHTHTHSVPNWVFSHTQTHKHTNCRLASYRTLAFYRCVNDGEDTRVDVPHRRCVSGVDRRWNEMRERGEENERMGENVYHFRSPPHTRHTTFNSAANIPLSLSPLFWYMPLSFRSRAVVSPYVRYTRFALYDSSNAISFSRMWSVDMRTSVWYPIGRRTITNSNSSSNSSSHSNTNETKLLRITIPISVFVNRSV